MTGHAEMKDMAQEQAVASDALTGFSLEGKAENVAHVEATSDNLEYAHDAEEPELHARTYIAVASMVVFAFVTVFALQGPPAVLTFIGTSLDNTVAQTWIPNALALPQAVLSPIISSVSDTFQARKFLIVGFSAIAFIGAGIAPGSQDIYRLIAAQTLIGFGLAVVPLSFCIPSETLPRKWRPMAQASINIGACLGAIVGPLSIGSLTRSNLTDGWRTYFWIQMGLWAFTTVGILLGYRPPKRHTKYDHLSVWQKLGRLDLVGSALLVIGMTFFLAGLNLGGVLYPWTNARVLVTLLIGIVGILAFAAYEWKGTKTGILHHDLFRGGAGAGRTFAICLGLMFVEGILMFAFVIFYPILTSTLFETDPLLNVARGQPFWIAAGLSTVVWGYTSTKLRTIREPLCAGYAIFTAGIVGLATTQPSSSITAVVMAGLTGLGFGSALILIVTGVQLASPHHLIATATAVTVCARAIGATLFTAINTAVFQTYIGQRLPAYVSQAALAAGLPAQYLPAFIGALSANDVDGLFKIPDVTPQIVAAGVLALKQSFADSLRLVFVIAAPFGAVACIACLFIGSLSKTMNYRVDAPVEELHAHSHSRQRQAEDLR